MKAMSLTEDHKIRLLEMCKVLFPEYNLKFGEFYTSEVGGEYQGLNYIDVTHTNHVIPAVKKRFELPENHPEYLVATSERFEKVIVGVVENTPETGYFARNFEGEINTKTGYFDVYVEGIHWFEFCMTHLVNTLYENEDYKDSSEYNVNLHVDLTLSMLNYKTHPVDYLYEEFKKIID